MRLERDGMYRKGGPERPDYDFKIDSTDSGLHTQRMIKRSGDMAFNMRRRDNDGPDNEKGPRWSINSNRESFGGPNRSNSQSFSYANINKDGIGTHISFHVSDANPETLKKISGTERADLSLNDLTITPLFSSGKTMLTFTLPEKATADVWFKDSEGKTLWTDKATGSFTKNFELPQNGIYFLQVKQGGKLSLRRIVKEQ